MATGAIEKAASTQNNLLNTDIVDLSSYTSTRYVFPGDGFIFINNNNNQSGNFVIYGAGQTTGYIRLGNAPGYYSCFVKKGMQCLYSGSSNTARYVKLS
mgnify:CR=1 FL=1